MRRGTILLQSERTLTLRRHYCVVLPFALAACLSLAPGLSNAHAGEESAVGDKRMTLDVSKTVLDDPEFLQASHDRIVCGSGCQSKSCQGCGVCSQPTNWLLGPYFKSGVNFVLGKGLLADSQDTGYSIVGGVRQFIGRGRWGGNAFVDYGGSYLSAFGTHTRDVPGEEFSPPLIPSLPPVLEGSIDVRSTLREVQRGGAHLGLGWYWGSPLDNRCSDPQIRFTTTFGGRLSHVRGKFFNEPVIAIPDDHWFTTSYEKTDTAGGLYLNAQAIFLNRNTVLGNLQWTVDGEFAHDWVNLGGFEKRGLGTASILFGFLLAR
jgi:hypothetical protein